MRAFVDKLLKVHGWIGEGDEIAQDILDYIDEAPPREIYGGKSVTVEQSWQEVFDEQGIT